METEFTPWASLLGGVLIGLAASLLMLANGRIAGVSGIVKGLIAPANRDDFSWRAAFVAGLVVGAAAMALLGTYDPATVRFPSAGILTVLAGLMVGAGTVLGGGCTSGHGICGLARLSPRSLAATSVFMAVAFFVVLLQRHVL
ncbi:MAG: YeeE/YedE family protein [Pseudomonadota bacterium]|nr:YeeE/YedE family protein [Pseudomonadota bacterium]